MSADRIPKAYIVVAPATGEGTRDRVISRKYHVRDAADQYAAMANASGTHPGAYVRTLYTNKPAPVAR